MKYIILLVLFVSCKGRENKHGVHVIDASGKGHDTVIYIDVTKPSINFDTTPLLVHIPCDTIYIHDTIFFNDRKHTVYLHDTVFITLSNPSFPCDSFVHYQ